VDESTLIIAAILVLVWAVDMGIREARRQALIARRQALVRSLGERTVVLLEMLDAAPSPWGEYEPPQRLKDGILKLIDDGRFRSGEIQEPKDVERFLGPGSGWMYDVVQEWTRRFAEPQSLRDSPNVRPWRLGTNGSIYAAMRTYAATREVMRTNYTRHSTVHGLHGTTSPPTAVPGPSIFDFIRGMTTGKGHYAEWNDWHGQYQAWVMNSSPTWRTAEGRQQIRALGLSPRGIMRFDLLATHSTREDDRRHEN
jgi:hypothetical protein